MIATASALPSLKQGSVTYSRVQEMFQGDRRGCRVKWWLLDRAQGTADDAVQTRQQGPLTQTPQSACRVLQCLQSPTASNVRLLNQI